MTRGNNKAVKLLNTRTRNLLIVATIIISIAILTQFRFIYDAILLNNTSVLSSLRSWKRDDVININNSSTIKSEDRYLYKFVNSQKNILPSLQPESSINIVNNINSIRKTERENSSKNNMEVTNDGRRKPRVVFLHHDKQPKSKDTKSKKRAKSTKTKNNFIEAHTSSYYQENYYEYDYYYRKAQLYDILSSDEQYYDPKTNTACTAMKEWQRISYSTCNILHEQNFSTSSYIASGMYRNVWKMKDGTSSSSYVVLKTYRLNRSWFESIYIKHKLESIAMAQMKNSKYINNIYANCGTSSIFEYVDSKLNLKEYINKYYNSSKIKPKDILHTAIDVSKALRDSHVFIYDNDSKQRYATVIHNDLKPEQYIYSNKHHRFILTDFNLCTFLTKNLTSVSSLQHNDHYHCEITTNITHKSKLKSPEDYVSNLPITDKSDVYVLGNIFFFILTSHYPYDYETKNGKLAIKYIVQGNKLPSLPNYFLNDTNVTKDNPYVQIVINAMYKCFVYDHRKRSSSYEIVRYLEQSKKDIISDNRIA